MILVCLLWDNKNEKAFPSLHNELQLTISPTFSFFFFVFKIGFGFGFVIMEWMGALFPFWEAVGLVGILEGRIIRWRR